MCEDTDIWEKSFRQKKRVEREGRESHEDQLIEVNWYGSRLFELLHLILLQKQMTAVKSSPEKALLSQQW